MARVAMLFRNGGTSMLELKNVCKSYTTGTFTQKALDDVSVAFRDNEFVAILGASGSGKTTMLNVIGGLDHFDSGDLVIDGISTKRYKDRDWDAYRNNRIGFVFQSYNLIPHQSVVANVELALTLSGVGAAERRRKALEALDRVGLSEHANKRPSQLSGGQMQRVAIARALINDPEILLADEPTGALDSKTSVAVMDLLKEVAADRLVIMVTHNPELAHEYATRIVELADGVVKSDSNPLTEEELGETREAKPTRRTSMSFLTALALSFNNLMTKKGRTIMTALAGSIGIIGIAAILALANGVNDYIANVEEETLSMYPLTIQSSGFDLSSMLVQTGAGGDAADGAPDDATADAAPDDASGGSDEGTPADDGRVEEVAILSDMLSSVGQNDLASLKEYLDANGGNINDYTNLIQYTYNVTPQIFSPDTSDGVRQVNPGTSYSSSDYSSEMSSYMNMSISTSVFYELVSDTSLIEENYRVLAGRWPEAYDELLLVVSSSGRVSDLVLYEMGLRDPDELDQMMQTLAEGGEVDAPEETLSFTYDELMAVTFKLVNASDMYSYDSEHDIWMSKAEDEDYMRDLVNEGVDLHIVGVVALDPDSDIATLSLGLHYTPELTHYLMDQAAQSEIVADQLSRPETNVLTGKSFDEEAEDEGSGFDLSSVFSVDENAISAAFSFDMSALNVDFSGLDFSSMSLPAVDLPPFDPSSIDMSSLGSAIDLSGIDVSGVDLSDIDLSGIDLSGVSIELPEGFELDYAALIAAAMSTVDTGSLGPVLSEISQGYIAYLAENPEATFADYLAIPEVGEKLNSAIAAAVDRDALTAAITAELARQIPEEVSDEIRDEITQQIGGQIGDQIASQIGEKIGTALRDQLVSTISQQLGAALSTQLTAALQSYMETALTQFMTQAMSALQSEISSAIQSSMSQLVSNMANAFHIDTEAFANAFSFNMTEDELAELMMAMFSTEKSSLDNNLAKFGYADEDKPSRIDIYPIDFVAKGKIVDILDGYNDDREAAGEDDKVITYTDLVGTLMSSVTEIVDMISAVLIAFVSISLVVSSIMIGVITYISVLERKKEIGILRSIGASKGNISSVFNAETVIEGLVSGILGVGITLLLSIPANRIVASIYDVERIAQLTPQNGIALIIISIILTFLAGLIPSSAASRKDPVEALRSE